jgi:hypothetical protein
VTHHGGPVHGEQVNRLPVESQDGWPAVGMFWKGTTMATDRTAEYAQRLLRIVMGDISEEHWAAGWLIGLEVHLWAMCCGDRIGNYGMGDVPQSQIEELQQLAADAGGWWTYEEFVPMQEWLARYEARQSA